MLADIATLPSAPPVDGLRIETVERSRRHDWAWLTCDGFGLDQDVRRAMAACEACVPDSVYEDQSRYTGLVDGKAVAVSSLVMAGGLAGVYAVATLPEARRRGIGTAMTLHAIAEGRRRGATMAVLQASSMGRPIYERIGFPLAYEYELYLQLA
jgi:GNAT superfamily N-acetyltransferase